MNNLISRCLAHSEDGQANGCGRRDSCLRHVAIRVSPFDDACLVLTRACTDDMLSMFIPIPPEDEQ